MTEIPEYLRLRAEDARRKMAAEHEGARTERRLQGHKITVTQDGDKVVLHAFTDGGPVTRLVYELSAEEAGEIAHELVVAAADLARDGRVLINELQFTLRQGTYTGDQIRHVAHPPISDDFDLFLVLDDGQEILTKDTNTVYVQENETAQFVTKSRSRP